MKYMKCKQDFGKETYLKPSTRKIERWECNMDGSQGDESRRKGEWSRLKKSITGLRMIPFLVSCNEFAGTPMQAPLNSSITRTAYRGSM
jgi:hypothetical protein